MSAVLDRIARQNVLIGQASGHRRTFKIVSGPLSGQIFVGTLRTQGALDSGMDLGPDIREKSILEVLRGAPYMEDETYVQEGVLQSGGLWVSEVTWKAVNREDNTADVEIQYDMSKVVEGVDQA